MSYKYTVDEWSSDTRQWTVRSKVKLTQDEVFEAWSNVGILEEDELMSTETSMGNTVAVVYNGVEYGDNCDYEFGGDEFEDENKERK